MVACYERASSPAADEGTHMHLVMAARIAGTTEPSCTSEQQEVAKIAMEMLRQCAWREGIACHVEERMAWYDMLGNEFCAGTPDLWWVDEEGTGHLVDWKFGTQPVPATDLQFAAYSRMICDATGAHEVKIHVIMPRVGTVAHSWWEASTANIVELDGVILAALHSGMTLRHGEHCRYCPAAHDCPEMRMAAGAMQVYDPVALGTESEIMRAMEAATAAKAIVRRASQRIADIEAAAVEWMKAGKSLNGWTLKRGVRKLKVEDINEAFRLSGLPADKFMLACDVSLPELSRIYAESAGMSTAAARKAMESMIAPALSESRGEWRLEQQ